MPDYDGLETKPEGDGAGIWTARVLLSPLYFTSEYLLRRPLGALTVAAESADVPRKLYDFFAFGPDHKIGFVPAGVVEFGFNPSVGFYGWWDDALVKHNAVRIHYEAWPTDWLGGSLTDRYEIKGHALELSAFGGSTRPDMTFYGIASGTPESNRSRYTDTRFDAREPVDALVAVEHGRGDARRSKGRSYERALRQRPEPGAAGSDAHAAFKIPFGFDRGYTAPYGRVLASVDTRRTTARGSGFHLEADAEEGADVQHAPGTGWVRWGGSASVFIDVNDHGRVLGLSVGTLFADPIGRDPIPFPELVSLGGETWMPGYFPGRLLDRSAAIAKLDYRWPVAAWLDGSIQAAVGNVFGAHLDGFRPDMLRFSGAIGLTTNGDLPIEMLLGFGTEAFAYGGAADSFRIAFGIPRRF